MRSPRVTSLLALYVVDGGEEDYADALSKYVAFLDTSGKGAYGLYDLLNLSGFVGLALLDMLEFGVTFGGEA